MGKRNGLLLMLALLLVLIPLGIDFDDNGHEPFAGADAQAEGVIQDLAPDYQPWFTSFWEPPGGEMESLLFAVQAALGAGFIGFYLGRSYERKHTEAAKEQKASPSLGASSR
ncbi:energy-coupling factor ABC transporter substrate-binding protein [Heliophilum fasciatum]|uniref:Cobalt transport protein CbiN n=1 Tax=Heliophilum fasciatum TaxID=35700 RepID=A0A4R2RJ78_9FIRM|nr:energy-coupling factor ABC transporter substrate-binding protein [Heliophilum fasciatum]MCW2278257.1 cobalt/nickel transport protein [Heliophilum fasciatum]TCP63882.1 cobalt/nickel transport protein [Heliophilum fasciatum]